MKRNTKSDNVVHFNPFDPEDVNRRLYHQVSALLSQIEERDSGEKLTMRERVQALIAIGRLQQIFVAMRKGGNDAGGTGSTVKKYAAAFSNAADRGVGNARDRSEPEPDDWFEPGDDDDPAA